MYTLLNAMIRTQWNFVLRGTNLHANSNLSRFYYGCDFSLNNPPRASVPGCRYGHTVCQYKGKLYMYGGRNDEDGSFSDVDCYDTGEH